MPHNQKANGTVVIPNAFLHVFLQQISEEQSYCKSIVKKQQQQAELGNLPRHHPLIREMHSDDGMQQFSYSA